MLKFGKANTPNELLTITGGGHGNFTPDQRTQVYMTIREFLKKNGLSHYFCHFHCRDGPETGCGSEPCERRVARDRRENAAQG